MGPEPDKGQPDDPRQANESGDPKTSGRSRGRVVDENDPQGGAKPSPEEPAEDGTERSEHWESGRQQAN